MKLYSYIVDHDFGFAPNPFYGFRTLAACKPRIRKYAQIGDYVVGTGPRQWSGALLYWAKVDEIISYDQYWNDERFFCKRPVLNGSLMQCFGDNIYHTNSEGDIVQEDSFHSKPHGECNEKNFRIDVGSTDRILISTHFLYLGTKFTMIPQRFSEIVHTTQGHKCRFADELKIEFVDWLEEEAVCGWIRDPIHWRKQGPSRK